MENLGDFLAGVWANELYLKIIVSVAIVLIIAVLQFLFHRFVLSRYHGDSYQTYTLRKIIDYAILGFGLVLLFALWIRQSADLTVALGLIAAGLAFALQEVIGSIAGWLSIVFGRPFILGDRIESGGIHGDVVDIGVLRTTLMETGNWLGGMQNTGRIVTLSNAFLFKEPLFNYSREMRYIWDEVQVSIPYGQDWERARLIMIEAINNHPAYIALRPIAEVENEAAMRRLAVELTPLNPRGFVKMADSWIEVAAIYPVSYKGRRGFRSDITEEILRRLAAEGIPLAYPTMTLDVAGAPSGEQPAA
jgi:small-conductance mechanosensitive channel